MNKLLRWIIPDTLDFWTDRIVWTAWEPRPHGKHWGQFVLADWYRNVYLPLMDKQEDTWYDD
jgi:hypothetical protein